MSPSKARPAVMDPSPMTVTTLWFSFRRSRASAKASPEEMEVPLWPTSKVS